MISKRAQLAVDPSRVRLETAMVQFSSRTRGDCACFIYPMSRVTARSNNAMSEPQKCDLLAEVKTLDVRRVSE